jgi:endoglucanase
MKNYLLWLFLVLTAPILAACGGSDDDEEDTPTPSVTISLRSCSITDGTEYSAATLTQATLRYNTTVAVANASAITLNGTACQAAISATTAMDVVVTLPALEEGKAYTLTVAEGAIVGKNDPTAKAPAYSVSFTTKAAPAPITGDVAALAKRLGWGWNLGNHFDTSSGEDGVKPQWGYWDKATPTASLYQRLKQIGASTVRIGVTWGNYQNTADWTIAADYMAEVRQNVEWAEQAGLNVILNLHHDEYWLDIKTAATNNIVNDQIKTRIEKTWKLIAEAFKDKGDFLFFEAYNEIQDGQWGWGANRTDGGKQYRTLNEWNQLVVNTIRATGSQNATRWIGIPAYASSAVYALDANFALPTDPAGHLMVSVHYYDPSNFTLTPEGEYGKSEWGHTADAGKAENGSNEELVTETFRKLKEKFIDKGTPVYIGEYGCVMHTNDRSNLFRNYYLEYVCRAAHTYGMPLCIWDNNSVGGGNEHHGYINHNDGTYLNNMEQLVQTMIRAATSDDASYTLESVYAKAPK